VSLLFSLQPLHASKHLERISCTRRRELYILVALHECAIIHKNVFLSPQLAAGLLCMQGQTVMLPSERDGLHPLVLPMCKDAEGRVTGLLKLPLKPATDLPVVRTTGKHLELLSPSLQQLIKRTVVQMEFDEDAAAAEVRSAAEKLGITVEEGVKGSPFGLERFILVKVTTT
jgi:hypothetical protein